MELHGLLLVAAAGLLGAPHCIGMCGGTVTAYAVNASAPPLQAVMAYNVGRIVTYTALGAFMGALGSFVNGAAALVGLRGAAGIVGGALMLLWIWAKIALPYERWSPVRLRFMRDLLRGTVGATELRAVFVSGIVLGFIPCGLTYAMQMNAAAAGRAGEGALIMAVFGLATLPALLAVGLLSAFIRKPLRRRMVQAGNVFAAAIGILAIMRGMAASGWIPSIHPWLW